MATARKGGSHERFVGGDNSSNRSLHHTTNCPRQRPTSHSNAPTTPATPTTPTALTAPTGTTVAWRSGYQPAAEDPCTGTRRRDRQRGRRRARIFPGYHYHDDDHLHHHHHHHHQHPHHRHRNGCPCKRMLPAAFARRQRVRWRHWPPHPPTIAPPDIQQSPLPPPPPLSPLLPPLQARVIQKTSSEERHQALRVRQLGEAGAIAGNGAR